MVPSSAYPKRPKPLIGRPKIWLTTAHYGRRHDELEASLLVSRFSSSGLSTHFHTMSGFPPGVYMIQNIEIYLTGDRKIGDPGRCPTGTGNECDPVIHR